MKKIVVVSGAGISADSGLPTFRGHDGLWKHYRFEEIASIQAWNNAPEDVISFYNMRRQALAAVEPNIAHKSLVRLEEKYDVTIITQNVDDLHERAGSRNIIHLHGELTYARSCESDKIKVHIGYRDMVYGERAADGSLLRPHIVWFGEAVPAVEEAIRQVRVADMIIIIGTSMVVYPAASLIQYVGPSARILLADIEKPTGLNASSGVELHLGRAINVVPKMIEMLMEE